MTDDFSKWLDGAPVIPNPGGETFSIWLNGAPVVTMGGNDATAVVTGSECNVETGTVVATGGAVATVTGSECNCETGTVDGQGQAPCTGSEVECETGTVTVTTSVDASVTGSEVHCETGEVTVTVINPSPFPGFAGVRRSHRIHSFNLKKPRPEKHRRRKREPTDDVLPVEIPVFEPEKPRLELKTVVARVSGSECRSETGLVRVRVDYPDDEATIKLILEALEMAEMMPDEPEALKTDDSDDLEAIILISEEV